MSNHWPSQALQLTSCALPISLISTASPCMSSDPQYGQRMPQMERYFCFCSSESFGITSSSVSPYCGLDYCRLVTGWWRLTCVREFGIRMAKRLENPAVDVADLVALWEARAEAERTA